MLNHKLESMKILDDLAESIGEAGVINNGDGTWSLLVSPQIVEDIYNVKEKVDSAEKTLSGLLE